MKRKRFVKLLMSEGMDRRLANENARKARKAACFESYAAEYNRFTNANLGPVKDIMSKIQRDFEETIGPLFETLNGPVQGQMQQCDGAGMCLTIEYTGGILGDAEDVKKWQQEELKKCIGND